MYTLQGGSKEKTLRTPQAKGDYIRIREPSNQQWITKGGIWNIDDIGNDKWNNAEMEWNGNGMAMEWHRNRMGDGVIKVDNMQHILGGPSVVWLSVTSV